ncbi:MAG: hypothetical protein MN733_17030, partial [Nitrososphaera sp.]|nr:hypothetical protein [Nitrososphaera sp.]
MNKNFFLFGLSALFLVFAGSTVLVRAGVNDNTFGFAWAGDDCSDANPDTGCGMGWIMLNAKHDDPPLWNGQLLDFGLPIGMTTDDGYKCKKS